MFPSILVTKLFIPPPRPELVVRARLSERLNEGLHRKLTLISAPAGFGKTTLVTEWLNNLQRDTKTGEQIKAAWLSLDENDNDPKRFLMYFIAALNQIEELETTFGNSSANMLQAPQPPSIEAVLYPLINEIAIISDKITFVFDDYHLIEAQPVHDIVTFLLEHLPPQMHLVIATREDPLLPLSRLRARHQLTELRAADLRFTPSEAAAFLNQVMGLNLSEEEIIALETRTEGWIAGLQLAALALHGLAQQGEISLRGHQDTASFIQSFTGSHHFILDYLIEEVLNQQSENIQAFLLRTSILERLCGPLCDAVLNSVSNSGQETLEYLQRANLFIIPLDNERYWYRYHHLFAGFLRQRLFQQLHQNTNSFSKGAEMSVAEYHIRASIWYENNGLEIDAFQHAITANDIERAARLVEGGGMPLLFRGAVTPVFNWLKSLPTAELDARPSLWVLYASALLFVNQIADVEEKAQAAEAALQKVLQGREPDVQTRDLIGHIASIRATVAVTQHQVETIIAQSQRALEYLHPDNLPVRTATTWTLGHAYQLQGERAAAHQAYTEAIAASQTIGHFIINIMAQLGLGNIQETENQLAQAAQTYQRVLELASDPPLPVACEGYLGLARIHYQWNDLEVALQHAQKSIQLARQIENTDRSIASEVFLARLKLTQGDVVAAAAILTEASRIAIQHNFEHLLPEIATAQVLTLIRKDNLTVAADLAEKYNLPLSQARVYLAQGDPSAALRILVPLHQQMEVKGWQDERLKVMVLQAVAHHANREKDQAAQWLGEALALAEPGGFIRIFVDEGLPMAELLSALAGSGVMPAYVEKLQAAFKVEKQNNADALSKPIAQPLIEPLSPREMEVLQLIALGLSNREISERLFLALSTVKGHNRVIFDKLNVQRRTEAVARARELGLL